MKETTHSRLVVFSRLWAVPTLLSVLLSITAVVAGMNGHKGWMTLAVLGSVFMLIVLLCQLVSAAVVRRWWHVAGSILGVAASVFVSVCSIVALGAGQYRPPVIIDGDGAGASWESPADSAFFSLADDHLSCSIVALVPETGLRQAVGEWLSENMGGRYTGDKADIQALVDFYGSDHADTLRSVYTEGVPEWAELSYEVSMDRVFETDKVVTYGLTITLNLGGAHPTTQELGATFSKADGRRLTWDMLRSDSKPQVRDMARELLKDYFNAATDSDLMRCLLGIDDVSHLPLPVTPPYMTAEGFELIYQQYEIAPYAQGMPGGVIPYGQFRPFLTPYVQELLPEDSSR